MFPGKLSKAAVLAVAASSPYVASETEWGRETTQSVTDLMRTTGVGTNPSRVPNGGITNDPSSDRYPVHAHHQVETLRGVTTTAYRYEPEIAKKLGAMPAADKSTPTLTGNRVPDIREVLRFDLTPPVILNRFTRVSTVLADLQLEGLRVPVVTGTKASDLAGTLTYYFDHTGAIQRITLHGFTGDPQRLVDTMQQFYQLQSEPSLEAGVYTRRWNGIPVHFLRLTHAPVVYSDAIHQKYTVFLELNQPNLRYGISDEAKRVVRTDRWTGRW